MHIALVYDVNNERVAHYKNGQLVKSFKLRGTKHLRIGKATIGNWRAPDELATAETQFRLLGTMDDFLIFNDAISANNIKKLYAASKSATK